jgi:uncharacterized membrane protein YczE
MLALTATRNPSPAAMTRWRASPSRLAQLTLGLCLFGLGEGLMIASELGNSPWTVLSEGLSRQTGVPVGTVTVAVSFAILLAWIPLRQRPGLGTIANAIVIGVAIDATLAVAGTPGALAARWAMLAGGIALVALGSGLYLTTFLGPGPRDGLMTGLHRRTGAPVAAIRVGIELTVLLAGFALGGTLGLGTLAFALAIGPAVALLLKLMAHDSLARL